MPPAAPTLGCFPSLSAHRVCPVLCGYLVSAPRSGEACVIFKGRQPSTAYRTSCAPLPSPPFPSSAAEREPDVQREAADVHAHVLPVLPLRLLHRCRPRVPTRAALAATGAQVRQGGKGAWGRLAIASLWGMGGGTRVVLAKVLTAKEGAKRASFWEGRARFSGVKICEQCGRG